MAPDGGLTLAGFLDRQGYITSTIFTNIYSASPSFDFAEKIDVVGASRRSIPLFSSDPVLINPLNLDNLAETFRRAVHIAPEEAATRMRALRETVRRHDVYRWSRACIEALEN